MGKKRGKDKSSREDEDFDLTGKVLYHHITQGSQRWLWFIKTYVSFLGPSCRHIKKGSEQNLLKKLAGNSDWTICQDCKQEENKENTNTSLPEAAEDQEETAEIWMCLKCGHRVSLYYQFIIHSLTLYDVMFFFWSFKTFLQGMWANLWEPACHRTLWDPSVWATLPCDQFGQLACLVSMLLWWTNKKA